MSARGRLFLAPRLTAGTSSELPGGPAYVWAVAVDTAGNTYLGTGPDGRVLKVTAAGAASVFFQADEPMITALAILPSGELLAGTAPDGKIYRIGRDGRGTLWADLDERYVWCLAVGPGGTVWAGTGDRIRLKPCDVLCATWYRDNIGALQYYESSFSDKLDIDRFWG